MHGEAFHGVQSTPQPLYDYNWTGDPSRLLDFYALSAGNRDSQAQRELQKELNQD